MNRRTVSILLFLFLSWIVGNIQVIDALLFADPTVKEAGISLVVLGIWTIGFFLLGVYDGENKVYRWLCLFAAGLVLILIPLSEVAPIVAALLSCFVLVPLTVPMVYLYEVQSIIKMDYINYVVYASTYLLLYFSNVAGNRMVRIRKSTEK